MWIPFLSRPCLICFVAPGDEANQAKNVRKNFDHYLDEYFGHARQEMDPDVNMENSKRCSKERGNTYGKETMTPTGIALVDWT